MDLGRKRIHDAFLQHVTMTAALAVIVSVDFLGERLRGVDSLVWVLSALPGDEGFLILGCMDYCRHPTKIGRSTEERVVRN